MTRWIALALVALVGAWNCATTLAEEAESWAPTQFDIGRSLVRGQGCFAPGTLFQWSYGNSFGGGPDLNAPLVTDRPDFTEASSTVGRGVAQIEFGYTYVLNDDAGTRDISHSVGEPLLRYGILAEWLELRLALFPTTANSVTGAMRTSNSGLEDLYAGFKIGLTPQEGFLPEMALIPQATLPTGDPAFTNDDVLPGVNWIYAWQVNDFISTGGSSQFNRSRDDGTLDTYVEFAQSWVIGYALAERLGAYTEWFAFVPSGAATAKPQHFFNGGFTYLLTQDMQFDVRAGAGLNGAADDYFVGTGLSIRFP